MPRLAIAWWTARFRRALEMLDMIRLDHFRGFEAYYEIPAGELTAVNGSWVKGPGAAFFEAIAAALGELANRRRKPRRHHARSRGSAQAVRISRHGDPAIRLRQRSPGARLQAAQLRHHLVAYTGTHDNDTVVGWWNSKAGAGSIRTAADVEKEMAYARRYLNTDGSDINWVMIRTLMASVAEYRSVPFAGCAGCRQRGPDEPSRQLVGQLALALPQGSLTPEISARLKEWADTYER